MLFQWQLLPGAGVVIKRLIVVTLVIAFGNGGWSADPRAIHGYPAYSHHDRFPPWWVFVRDDNGGNLSGDKIPPLMMIIINHLTQFNSSHW